MTPLMFDSPDTLPAPSGTIPQAPEGIGLEFCILKVAQKGPECIITI
eukprot:COSAG02_NODE_225_length_28184_cov_16.570981_6_plen_47_part_00